MPHLSLHTPVGDITLFEEDGELVSVDWGWVGNDKPTPVLKRAKQQIDEYFDGKRTEFDLPLNPAGSVFQKKVWKALSKIPYGQTRTYGEIAKSVQGSARAVGYGCGSNHLPIIIPCHRVLAAGGKLGGYSGDGGLDTKTALLKLEGAMQELF